MLGSARMAEVKPFRAERYDEAKAGPLAELVAPPYDVISPEERDEYLARSPYNVVHLTLPDDEEQAGRDLAGRRAAHPIGARCLAPRRGVRARSRAPARADASRSEGGPAPSAARDAHAARADLPPLRGRSARAAGARARRPERRGQALAHRRGTEVRRRRAPDRRRPPPLRDGACLCGRGRPAVPDGR